MAVVCDLILICLSCLIAFQAYRRLFKRSLNTVADFVILVVFAFMCVPVILNYVAGIPEYSTAYWYAVFIPPMENETVTFVYDFYVSMVLVCLYFCSSRKAREPEEIRFRIAPRRGTVNHTLAICLIAAPYVAIALSGNLFHYAIYADSSARGLDESFVFVLNSLMLLSLFVFSSVYFEKTNRGKRYVLLLLLYSISIAWISGKRFIVALMLVMYLFFFLSYEADESKREKLRKAIPAILLGLVIFSGLYMSVIKPLTNTINYDVYEMLRVDFGRDDVTKYVIYHYLILGESIVDYPGQSLLSYLFFFVPRSVWPTKPWLHYQYLTSSILGVPMSQIPAGTTPSGFEMFFANFGISGMALFAIALVLLMKLFDVHRTPVPLRALGVVLIMVLLTQSIDVYLVYVVLAACMLVVVFLKSHLAKRWKKHGMEMRREAR